MINITTFVGRVRIVMTIYELNECLSGTLQEDRRFSVIGVVSVIDLTLIRHTSPHTLA